MHVVGTWTYRLLHGHGPDPIHLSSTANLYKVLGEYLLNYSILHNDNTHLKSQLDLDYQIQRNKKLLPVYL